MTDWRDTEVATDATHHLRAGVACYSRRFDHVMKFHAPGLAPVRHGDLAWHIDFRGADAYPYRYKQAFGFYESRAAVETTDGWCHIAPDGVPVDATRHSWCGNFQESRCAVRDESGHYFHIRPDGQRAYQVTHLYVGDFRDGVAVVRCSDDQLCTHITSDGEILHDQRFLALDAFHKGFARARDHSGWFHVNRSGRPAYSTRFADIEPFYNGVALAWTWRGDQVLVDERGAIRLHIATPSEPPRAPMAKLLLLGNVAAGKSTVCGALEQLLPWPAYSIDECRCIHGDGSPAGEMRAWAAFLERAVHPGPAILECTGVGPQAALLQLALAQSNCRFAVAWVRTPIDDCVSRAGLRKTSVPYPAFGAPLTRVAVDLHDRVAASMSTGGAWHDQLLVEVDGTHSPSDQAQAILNRLGKWLEG